MVRHSTIILTLLFLAACGNPKVKDGLSENQISENEAETEIPDTLTESTQIDTIKRINRSNWTNLDYLNQSTEFPFIPEDSIIGIGIVTISDRFDIYKDKLKIYDIAENVIVSIQEKDEIVTTFKGKKLKGNDIHSPFAPRLFSSNPDYFRLALDCLEADNDSYNVIINRKTGETARIKKDDVFFEFQSIAVYVENWTGLSFDFDRSTNPIRKSASDDSRIIKNSLNSNYKIWNAQNISMKGDWLEIEIEDTHEKGWIRWRKGNQILIRMYYAC